MRSIALVLGLLVALAPAGCGKAPTSVTTRTATGLKAASSSFARALAPKDIPAALVAAAQAPAQAAADEASKRRDIDTFAIPGNPVGLEIGQGPGAAHVLSFLGTARHDAELDIELRAFVAGNSRAPQAISMNYSGPTTLTRALGMPALPAFPPERDAAAVSFELITGLPGDDVTGAYSDYMSHFSDMLAQKYGAQSFTWDDTPIVFALHQGDAVTGFVFTNQGNRMILGDQKYADVQSVAAFTAQGDFGGAYTVVGFNRKTAGAGAAPVWHVEKDARFGMIARCGQI